MKEFLCNIQTVDSNMNDETTPFDTFDTNFHDDHIGKTLSGMPEENLMFLINTSEHLKRPKDMLMFLGEYFKEHIK